MKTIAVIFIMFGALLSISAQKRPVTVEDFNNWNSLASVNLSDNGKKIAYEIKPGKGDSRLIIMTLNSSKKDTLHRASGIQFNGETNMAAFKINPSINDRRHSKKENLPKTKAPKDSLGILLFDKDTLIKFPTLKSFAVPKYGGLWTAFTSEEKFLPPKDTTGTDSIKTKPPKLAKGGNNMVIFNGSTLDTMIMRNVTGFSWSKNGNILAFSTEKEDSVKQSSVKTFNTIDNTIETLFSIKGEIKKLSIDDAGQYLAWLSSEDTLKKKTFDLRIAFLEDKRVELIADTLSAELPEKWAPSEHGSIYFSESGERLYFGSAEKPEQEPKDTLLDGEKVSVDIWSWTDAALQPEQKVNLSKEKNKTYLAVYHINKEKLVQLANEKIENLSANRRFDKKVLLSSNRENYKRENSWSARYLSDYWLVDLFTGTKTKLLEGVNRAWISPSEKYVVYYQFCDSNYYIKPLKKGDERLLSKGIPTLLVDEENDLPNDPRPYGIAAWSQNDEYVYIYDRYDIWQVDPIGKEDPVNISNGRNEKTIYRLRQLDSEKDFISTSELQLLTLFNEQSKATGWANIDLKSMNGPEKLFLEPKYYSSPVKAKNADIMYYTRQDCNEYPDLWLTKRDLSDARKISNVNPQKDEFIWSTVELVKWTSFNGEKLEGLLYKPENFDPEKRYPMVVYFYERSSDNLYRFNSIFPSHSIINKTFYPSNGYLVFIPDIKYRIGFPGQSAYECIVSGVQSLTEKHEWIDAKRIGLQGQSWGGYQTAYLITQTNMFAAAMAGAPVSNMTSAYGGIRWASGMSRMFQYENTQSRIGGTLWDKPLLYIENSPLFYANKVKTPLLMMHNDNDGAVPWYQGIELFVALRRLEKPVWMLNYNNEPHNLKPSSWGNRMDLSIRMKQFFDHYLKDGEKPDWMKYGVKAVDKEYMKGY